MPMVSTPRPVVFLDVSLLLLDGENPRLATATEEGTSQDEIVRTLWNEESVDEVAQSIAKNGFFQWEPLLVVPRGKKYVVAEGNRRLAAVRLLREGGLGAKLKIGDLPSATPSVLAGLAKLPAVSFDDRKDLWSYLGFRHINGTKPWDAFSKAKYVASVHDKYHLPLAKIAERIGDRHSTVQRLYRGYEVLKQAEELRLFDREDRSKNHFSFSHLYTAVDQPEYQEFLGIQNARFGPNPVPKSKRANLKELLLYLYGKTSEAREPVVRSQNPDLNRLREVLAKPAALAILRAGRSLDAAHVVSRGDVMRFHDSIETAKDKLQEAKATVTTGYNGDSGALKTVEEIVAIVETIRKEMLAKREGKA